MATFKIVMKVLLGVVFILAGANHFANAAFYVRIMPPYLPWHEPLVYISGAFEIGLGILLLVPRYTTLAAWGIIALLVSVSPANLHMALHAEDFSDRFSPVALWLRLPFQAVPMVWAYWFTHPGPEEPLPK